MRIMSFGQGAESLEAVVISYQRTLLEHRKEFYIHNIEHPFKMWYNNKRIIERRMISMKVMVAKGFEFSKLEELGYTYNVIEGGYVSSDKSTIVIDSRSGHENEVNQLLPDAEASFERNVEELSQRGYLWRPLELSPRTNFVIDTSKTVDIFSALQEAAENSKGFPSRDVILESKTLEEALAGKMKFDEMFFEIRLNTSESKNLELNDKPILDVMAPFVCEGAFIEFWLEGKHLRRWIFDGAVCLTSYCTMNWSDPA